jgi:ribonuclease R
MAAERDAADRYVAAFLAADVGAEFTGRITGVTRFGLFVRLADTGADGLIPISSLGGEYFVHDEAKHTLVGERTGGVWRLGRTVDVRLKQANPITGGLLLEMLSEPEPVQAGAAAGRGKRPGRGAFRRGRARPGGRRR